ncbi:MAG: anaerobic glycerol-3-phosphate dehydrogenase subunit GlpB [Candidatus Thorarchaeota archaeon]
MEADLLVIGGGMAGLAAGTISAENGLQTIVVRKGQSATAYSSGAIDVIGYLPDATEPFGTPREGLTAIAGLYPLHPYSIVGYSNDVNPEKVVDIIVDRTQEAVIWLKTHLDGTIAALDGDFNTNIDPITILGTSKPTCLIQKTMNPGDVQEQDDSTLLFVGISGYPDFNPAAAAKTYLEDRISYGLPPRKVVHCSVQVSPFGNAQNISGIEIARHLDHAESIDEFAEQLKVQVEKVGATHVALPPILGLRKAIQNQNRLKQLLGSNVFELLGFPPSVPGLRLQLALEEIFRKSGGNLLIGHEVVSYQMMEDKIEIVNARAPRREIQVRAKAFILASGKFIGTGLVGDEKGVRETIFDLTTITQSYHSANNLLPSKATSRIPITPVGQPIFSTGITLDPQYRPIRDDGIEWAENLFAAGSVLAGYNYSVEKSGLGVALTSGFSAATNAISYIKEVS